MRSSLSRRTFLGAAAAGAASLPTIGYAAGAEKSAGPIRLDKPLPVEELPTPALLIDLDRMESNLRKMARDAKAMNVGVRPHAKTHKCPIIAKMQMDLGADPC